jgi:hypothetical protein
MHKQISMSEYVEMFSENAAAHGEQYIECAPTCYSLLQELRGYKLLSSCSLAGTCNSVHNWIMLAPEITSIVVIICEYSEVNHVTGRGSL